MPRVGKKKTFLNFYNLVRKAKARKVKVKEDVIDLSFDTSHLT